MNSWILNSCKRDKFCRLHIRKTLGKKKIKQEKELFCSERGNNSIDK